MSRPQNRNGNKLETVNGFDLYEPTRNGKAGPDGPKTRAIQVVKDNAQVAVVRYNTSIGGGRDAALVKARKIANNNGIDVKDKAARS